LADVAEMVSEARVVALDRRWPGDIADRGNDLLDIVFGWADFSKLRRLVAGQCAAAGLTGNRLDDFVLAVHEIAANAIVHAGEAGRLILRRASSGLRCLVTDAIPEIPPAAAGRPAPRPGQAPALELAPELADYAEPGEPVGSDSGRGLWLAATLADELSITSGPDSTIVSLFMRLD
jgi:anti-sigma regulatory factor (Ser/Thr protein kinase)